MLSRLFMRLPRPDRPVAPGRRRLVEQTVTFTATGDPSRIQACWIDVYETRSGRLAPSGGQAVAVTTDAFERFVSGDGASWTPERPDALERFRAGVARGLRYDPFDALERSA